MPTSLASDLKERLSPPLLDLLTVAGSIAREEGLRLCLVGGAVRDLLLGKAVSDLDLVVEGDAAALAYALAKKQGGDVVAYQRFGTATYRQTQPSDPSTIRPFDKLRAQGSGLRLDLATARSESYPRPGALPLVSPNTLEKDLFRRDFSINAMAADLSPTGFGRLIDPFNGLRDLGQKSIRVLHDKSFSDDPTRMLRAVRYEQRLGFAIEDDTLRLMKENREGLGRITGERIRHELELILQEERPELAVARAHGLGLLRAIHPALRGDAWLARRWREARERPAMAKRLPPLYFALWLYRLDSEDAEAVIARLKATAAWRDAARDTQALKGTLRKLAAPRLKPSQAYRLLRGFREEAVAACHLATADGRVRERLSSYLEEWRYVKSALSGRDLVALGLPQGPAIGEALEALREQRLDGAIRSREEEEAFVRERFGNPTTL